MSNQNKVSNSDFWDECYIDGNIGWDLGEATPVFKDLCHKIKKNSSIFIPGAGNGYDPIYFAKNGHDVTAADFSIKAVENMISKSNKDNIKLNVLHADIFSLDRQLIQKFDYVIEYTCFCAIERSRRMEYIKSMHQILKKDGELIGLFLPVNKKIEDGGPPYSIVIENVINQFSNYFDVIESKKHPLSINARKDNEYYIHFKKK
tara:strand:+ start:3225 stop:3836 length:612 start_codon:yes stop_codon:yes gene_type:complete